MARILKLVACFLKSKPLIFYPLKTHLKLARKVQTNTDANIYDNKNGTYKPVTIAFFRLCYMASSLFNQAFNKGSEITVRRLSTSISSLFINAFFIILTLAEEPS